MNKKLSVKIAIIGTGEMVKSLNKLSATAFKLGSEIEGIFLKNCIAFVSLPGHRLSKQARKELHKTYLKNKTK